MLKALEQTRAQFREELQPLLDQMQVANTFEEKIQLRGKISGVYRRYRAELLVIITTWAINQTPGTEPTKFSVARWQKLTFQRSLNNERLAELWCDPKRTSGERGTFDIPDDVTRLVSEAFSIYAAALNSEPDAALVEMLSTAVAERELGL